jgi:hypothetical protein
MLVPIVPHVIHGPGIFNAQLARHEQRSPTRPRGFSSEDLHEAEANPARRKPALTESAPQVARPQLLKRTKWEPCRARTGVAPDRQRNAAGRVKNEDLLRRGEWTQILGVHKAIQSHHKANW